eukprot:9001682-Ditylum_brightwellii.AAC.1
MDCIGHQSQGRIQVLQFCDGNREQDPIEGERTISRKQHSNGILCAESSRGLAALRFLFCNNNTLMGCIQWQQQCILNNPDELLGPNFDIQMVIDKSPQELIVPYKCTHVQGHQDRKDKHKQTDRKMQLADSVIRAEENSSNNNLTWEATLNIVADNLATAAYQRL